VRFGQLNFTDDVYLDVEGGDTVVVDGKYAIPTSHDLTRVPNPLYNATPNPRGGGFTRAGSIQIKGGNGTLYDIPTPMEGAEV
jgi:hypothetical protein